MATRTRSFGAGNRESHDAAPFYERFTAPELSDDELDLLRLGDGPYLLLETPHGIEQPGFDSYLFELRLQGANDAVTYRVHKKLGQPCHVCGTPLAQVDFEEHTIFYCPNCQTGGRILKDRRLSRLLR